MDGDIELEITPGPGVGEYTARVVQAPVGADTSVTFTLDVGEIADRRAMLEATVLSTAVSARRVVPVAEQEIQQIGRRLFETLFSRELYGTYRASQAAQAEGRQLRVVLRLNAPELSVLPWETLYDPETAAYLCRTQPLVRRLPAPNFHSRPLDIEAPLRILGIVSAPRGLPALDVEAEKQHLATALATPIAEGKIELVWTSAGTWDSLASHLLEGPWHALHFIGHGDYDPVVDEGTIALVGEDGRAAMVSALSLVDLFSIATPRPRLVVLNSCSSGQCSGQDMFSGVAASLVRSGINAVVAMQFTVSDTAAVAFARGFYSALAGSRSVDEATRIGRIAILGNRTGSLEWVTPVLYVREGSTQLFHLANTSPSPPPVTPPVEPSQRHPAQLRLLYIQANAEIRAKNFESAISLLDDLLTLDPDNTKAIAMRQTAMHRKGQADTYSRARDAEEAGNWEEAARTYTLLQNEPAFPDATVRRAKCEKHQRIEDLQTELRLHAETQHWQEVLDVAEELRGVDPSVADPDQLVTCARLELRYQHARRAEDAQDHTEAIRAYQDILATDPDFRDAATRRADCEKHQRIEDLQTELRVHAVAGNWTQILEIDAELSQIDATLANPQGLAARARLELRYQHARRAEDAQDHTEAIRAYQNILATDPDFRDAATRRADCEKHQRIEDLQTELRVHAVAGNWTQILEIDAELSQIDATLANPQGLAARARLELRYQHARRAEDAQDHTEAIRAYQNILATDPDFRDVAARAINLSAHPAAPYFETGSPSRLSAINRHSGEVRHTVNTPVDAGEPGTGARTNISHQVNLKLSAQLEPTNGGGEIAFSSAGRRIARGNHKGSVEIWDIVSRRKIFALKAANGIFDELGAIAFSPAGERLATTGGKSFRVWNVKDGTLLMQRRAVFAFGDALSCISFSPDGTRIATGGTSHFPCVWNSVTGEPLVDLNKSHSSLALKISNAVAFDPTGRRIISFFSRALTVWDAYTGTEVLTIKQSGSHDDIIAAFYAANGSQLITVTAAQVVRRWDATTGEMLRSYGPPRSQRYPCMRAALSPDGQFLATVEGSVRLHLWDNETGAHLYSSTLSERSAVPVGKLAFHPSANQLAIALYGEPLSIWDVVGKSTK